MNLLGHVHVARVTAGDDPLFLLGAALPDLASIARVRVRRERLSPQLASGVQCHLDVDARFHAHPEFLQGSAALRADLRSVGMASGPARAIGHIGWELILDGTLVGSASEGAYWQALERADAVGAALEGGEERSRWERFLRHRGRRPRLRYDDIEWVADRVHDALADRPRLVFPRAQLPLIRTVLQRHSGDVASAAPAVFDDLASADQ